MRASADTTSRRPANASAPAERRPRLDKSRRRRSRARFAVDQPKQNVIPPGAVDLEIAARIAFTPKGVALEEGDRGGVVGDAGRLDPVESEPRKGKFDGRCDRSCH